MNLTLTAERHGFQNGERHGFQNGEIHILMNQLKTKFKDVPEEYIDRIKNADLIKLDLWSINFINARTIEEVFNN